MNSFLLLLLALGVGAALVTWLLVGQLIRLAPRLGLLDRPNERSSHTRVTPRGGGIGFVVAIALGLAVWAVWGAPSTAAGDLQDGFGLGPAARLPAAVNAPVLVVLLAALFIAAISLRDDFKSLGAGLRFACHFAAAGAAVWAFGVFRSIELPLVGPVALGAALGGALTVVWIVGLTNVYNFMDGIDGIAGGQGVAAGVGWMLVGVAFAAPSTAVLGVLLAGGCAGFLVHNWSPAKIFMGDVGSAFLGFLFAVVPLVAAREAPEVAAAWPVFGGLAVWPFVGDGFLTFVRRALKREKVWAAHRSHLYQRLVQTGWKHASVSELYGAWAALTVAVAWLWLTGLPGAAAGVLVLPPATLAALFWFVSRRERAVAGGR
jgi:UDP-N-acetylmuramyl pentapeptide phosphotransferase/UDP-N-acetylglucosamine-1-phosphate transferase